MLPDLKPFNRDKAIAKWTGELSVREHDKKRRPINLFNLTGDIIRIHQGDLVSGRELSLPFETGFSEIILVPWISDDGNAANISVNFDFRDRHREAFGLQRKTSERGRVTYQTFALIPAIPWRIIDNYITDEQLIKVKLYDDQTTSVARTLWKHSEALRRDIDNSNPVGHGPFTTPLGFIDLEVDRGRLPFSTS